MKEMARLFRDQCLGEYNGHMSKIPYNPVLKSIFDACGLGKQTGESDFTRILRQFADALDKERMNSPF